MIPRGNLKKEKEGTYSNSRLLLIRWGASQVQFLFLFLQRANLIGPSPKI